MNILRLIFLFLLLAIHSGGQGINTWTPVSDMGGASRQDAFSFALNGFGYTGTGADSSGNLFDDCWKYDPSSDTWSQVANFSGGARRGATAFSIGNAAFAGTGYDGISELKDFWTYDPVGNNWTRLQDLGTYLTGNIPGRVHTTGLATRTKGYLIAGYDGSPSYLKQTLQFDPANDTMWRVMRNIANVSDLTLFGRRWCSGFVIDSTVYFGTGFSFSQDIKKDFWKFDPVLNAWSQMADFGGGFRSNAFGFNLGSKGYIGGGTDGSYRADMWRYDAALNNWTQVADFGGGQRINTSVFTIGNRAYVGCGLDQNGSTRTDFWMYTPDSTAAVDETDILARSIIVNAANGTIQTDLSSVQDWRSGEFILVAYSLDGRKLLESGIQLQHQKISTPGLSAGIIVYSMMRNGKIVKSGKILVTE